MTDRRQSGDEPSTDLEKLARRFQDLWQDQMAAVAADPEAAAMMEKWFGAAAGANPSGSAANPFSGPFPGMIPGLMPGAAGPLGAMDPAAWLKALGLDTAGAKSGRSETADDPTTAGAGDAAPPGPAPAAAASGAGDVAGDQFERRFADFEKRLDRLEAAFGGTRRGTAKGPRKSRS